jgi:hypothetical protein
MLLDMDRWEVEVVADVLRRAMGDLREEIYKTEARHYEVELKRREAVLAGLIAKLAAAQASGLTVGEPASKR